MAVLGESDRAAVWADIMERLSRAGIPTALSKAEFRAAVDAADDWVDTNAAAYNLALPVAARSDLSAGEKALLLVLVAGRRYGGG